MWDGKGVFEELPVAPREALGATDAVAKEEDDDEAALAPVADGLDEPEELAEKSGELDVLGTTVAVDVASALRAADPEAGKVSVAEKEGTATPVALANAEREGAVDGAAVGVGEIVDGLLASAVGVGEIVDGPLASAVGVSGEIVSLRVKNGVLPVVHELLAVPVAGHTLDPEGAPGHGNGPSARPPQ